MAEPAVAASSVAKRGAGFDLTNVAWDALLQDKGVLNLPDLQIQPLPAFLKDAESQPLAQEEKEIILQEAAFLIGNMYPHLPFKTQLYSSARPLEMLQTAHQSKGERDWHANVIFSISSVLDAHTLYGLPSPYRDAVAFLPFELKVYWDRHQSAHFIVTAVMNALADSPDQGSSFGPGAEILGWNGSPADVYLRASRGRMPSGNYYAGIRRGTMLATLLPLRFCQPPEEDSATLHYLPAGGGSPQEICLPWGVATGLGSKTGFPGNAFSVSPVTHCADAMNRVFVGRRTAVSEPSAPPSPSDLSQLPDVFEFQYSKGTPRPGLPDPERLRSASLPDARFGYIRIRKFSHGATLGTAVVDEFRRILETVMNQNAPDGLVIDIRGNPGGDIVVAESLLQMLTAETISPLNFHLANTPTVRDFLRGLLKPDFSKLDAAAILKVILVAKDLRAWIDDVDNFDPHSPLSTGHPLTKPEDANAIGRIYHGKCVLLMDALSYSAADIFAAGFQDHEIGPVIGSDATTGGGGANVWSHSDLASHLVAIPNLPDPKPLPKDAALSLAIRRATRVRKNAGVAIEDFGVQADAFFSAGSAEELLAGSQSIVQFACDHLTAPRVSQIEIRSAVRREHHLEIEIEAGNVDFVQVYVDGCMGLVADVTGGPSHLLRVPAPEAGAKPFEVCVRASYFYNAGREGPPDNFVHGAEAKAVVS